MALGSKILPYKIIKTGKVLMGGLNDAIVCNKYYIFLPQGHLFIINEFWDVFSSLKGLAFPKP